MWNRHEAVEKALNQSKQPPAAFEQVKMMGVHIPVE